MDGCSLRRKSSRYSGGPWKYGKFFIDNEDLQSLKGKGHVTEYVMDAFISVRRKDHHCKDVLQIPFVHEHVSAK